MGGNHATKEETLKWTKKPALSLQHSEETRAAFAKTDAALNALLKQMSDQHERLIEQIKSLSHDFQNTKGFLMR